MSEKTFFYGFIETDPNEDDFNRAVIQSFHNQDWPGFTDMLADPVHGFRCSTIAFARCYNRFDEEWDEWKLIFEAFLKDLRAIAARVDLFSDERGDRWSLLYFHKSYPIPGEWPEVGKQEWKLYIYKKEGMQVVEEEEYALFL